MESLRAQSRAIVGQRSSKIWMQTERAKIGERELTILAIFETRENEQRQDLAEIGRLWLQKVYSGQAIQESIKEVSSSVSVSLAAAYIERDSITIYRHGYCSIYLLRDKKLAKLDDSGLAWQKIEGQAANEDRLLLVSRRLEEILGTPKIKEILEADENKLDEVSVKVQGMSDSEQLILNRLVITPSEQPAESYQLPKLNTLNIGRRTKKILSKLVIKKPLLLSEEKKRHNVLIGFALIALLLIGVVVGTVTQVRKNRESGYITLEGSVRQKMEEARSVSDLNPERAKVLLAQADYEIEQYLDNVRDQTYRQRAMSLKLDQEEVERQIFRLQSVQIATLIEFSLLANTLSSPELVLDEDGNIYVYEQNSRRVMGVNVVDKSKITRESTFADQQKSFEIEGEAVYGIGPRGVVRQTDKEETVEIAPDELWGEIAEIELFARNIYLLDTGESEIWKYAKLDSGYGTRKRWLAPGVRLDLSRVIDIEIDGDIWILTDSGKLERYSSGVPKIFSMEGFPYATEGKLSDPVALYIRDSEVFVLERAAKRIVVFERESGKYLRQFASDELGTAADLVVYQDKAYVSLPDRIGWIEI